MKISRTLVTARALNMDSNANVSLKRRRKTINLETLRPAISGDYEQIEVFAGDKSLIYAAEK